MNFTMTMWSIIITKNTFLFHQQMILINQTNTGIQTQKIYILPRGRTTESPGVFIGTKIIDCSVEEPPATRPIRIINLHRGSLEKKYLDYIYFFCF